MATTPPPAQIAAESLASWETNAPTWDHYMGADGNIYWAELQVPYLERLLGDAVKPGSRALDLATGNGLGARWMARRGARVLATDATAGMLSVAEERVRADEDVVAAGGGVEFRKLDVTSSDDFEKLIAEGESFDAILMNMAIMDVASTDALAAALPKLLRKDGVFVCSLLHPVFFTSRASRSIEVRDDNEQGGRDVIYTKTLRGYMHVPPWKGWAIIGQPAQQYYFHRPLHELFGTFFKAGLLMDALEEPGFTEKHANPKRIESTLNFWQFPALMVFRLRRSV